MSAKSFVIEVGSGPASDRRLHEALELAAGLAAFDHGVRLILRASAVARLASARGADELGDSLEALAGRGVGPALTDTPGAPEHLGPLALTSGDPGALRAQADAVLVF